MAEGKAQIEHQDDNARIAGEVRNLQSETTW
jgi:hypothetical protein